MGVDVVARLKLRAQDFSREVRKAFADVPEEADRAGNEAGERMGAGIGAGLKRVLGAIAIGSIVQQLADLTMRAVEFGAELDNNAKALNTSVEELQAYREAGSDANIMHQQLDDGLQELLKTMIKAEGGNKDAVAAFRGLGVEMRETDGQVKTTTAVMGEVIDQIRRIPDPLRQAQYGAALFGDQWSNVAPILHAGSDGLQALTGDILATGDALSTKEIQELARVNAEFERMKNTLEVDVSQTVAANAGAIITLGQAFAYMAGQAVTALAAVVNLYRGLNADGTYAGSNAAKEESKRIEVQNRGGSYDPDSWAAWFGIRSEGERGTLRPRDPRRPDSGMVRVGLPKGGRGGGGGVGNWREQQAVAALPIADPLNAARLGGGGPSPKKKGGGGVDKEAREREREAQRLAQEYARIEQSLGRALDDQREAAQVEELRAAGMERQADYQEAINQLNDKWRDIAGKTADEVAKRFNITTEKAKELMVQLDQLSAGTIVKIDLEYGRKEMAEISKEIDRQFETTMQRQADEMAAAWEAADDIARQNLENLSGAFYDLFDGNIRNLWDNFERLGLEALAALAADETLKLLNGKPGAKVGDSLTKLFTAQGGGKSDLMGGISKGALASSIADAIGIKQSKTGAMVGAGIGSMTGIPFADTIGALIGGTIGGMFKKTPRGYATIGGEGTDLRIVGAGGNSKNAQAQGNKAAGATLTSLDQIAQALGGTYDASRGRVSIGRSGDSWHVDTSGQGKLKKSQGGFDFDDDYEAAVRFATMDLIKDGVLQGISDAAQRILQNAGDDIEGALEKALMIEELPKRLKARLDPLGAALDEIDAQFTRLADVLREGGASAEQIAQARQLWELERADAIREIGQASATLRDYLKTLRIGADSPLSLRTQALEAEAAMAPFVDQIRKADAAKADYDRLSASKAAGGAVSDAELKAAKDAATAAASAIDQSGFRDSAALFLDVARQLGGSTKSFFDQFDRIQGLTNNAISLVENAVPLRGDAKDPFAELTAKSTQATAAILDQHTQLLQQIANGTLGRGYNSEPGDVFIGNPRNFARNDLR